MQRLDSGSAAANGTVERLMWIVRTGDQRQALAAASLLGELGHSMAIPLLLDLLGNDEISTGVREAVAVGLSHFVTPVDVDELDSAVKPLYTAANRNRDELNKLRRLVDAAYVSLRQRTEEAAKRPTEFDRLMKGLSDFKGAAEEDFVKAMDSPLDKGQIGVLVRKALDIFQQSTSGIPERAAEVIVRFSGPEAIETLAATVQNPDCAMSLRCKAFKTLETLSSKQISHGLTSSRF